jgi:serine O-acetyltransferase
MKFIDRLVYWRRYRLAREILALYGVEIGATVEIGEDFQLLHRGFGTVIHPDTTIGDRVRIFHQVTIGRADAHILREHSKMLRVVIEDDVILFPGAKILGGEGITRVGLGTIVAANAVLLNSTGDNEVWAGVPARRIAARQ